MTSPAIAQLPQLTSDELIHERVSDLVGRAISRQLWLMFLDENDAQLPLLVPVSDLPSAPPIEIASLIIGTADAVGARGIIVVLERYGDESLTAADRAWARHIHLCCAEAPARLRGILLSHARGVRWVAPDDYLY
jgi:hypothetical protein